MSSGNDDETRPVPGFFRSYLTRRLPGDDVEIACPTYSYAGLLCTHGHYLDRHLLPIIITLLSNADFTRATALAAYIQIVRLGGAEIGISLMGTWLRVREQIHSNYLGQHVENGSDNVVRMLKQLSDFFASHGTGTAPARAIGTLAALVQREANTLAYIDGFWLCFWLAMTALGVTALITRAPPGPFTPAPFGFAKAVLRRCGVAVS